MTHVYIDKEGKLIVGGHEIQPGRDGGLTEALLDQWRDEASLAFDLESRPTWQHILIPSFGEENRLYHEDAQLLRSLGLIK